MLPTYVHRWHITDEYKGRPPWQLAKVTWPLCSLAHRRTYFRQQTEAVEVVDWVVVIRVGPAVGHVIYRGAGGDGPRQLRRRQGRCCVVCPGSCSGDSVQGGACFLDGSMRHVATACGGTCVRGSFQMKGKKKKEHWRFLNPLIFVGLI
jgi:hypothetical protein